MISALEQPNATPAQRLSGRVSRVQFSRGGAMAKQAAKKLTQEAGEKIPYLPVARKIENLFKHRLFQNNDIRFWNFSLEDVASRVQTLVGVYLLQGYFSIKDQKHPYETNGRNAVVWSLGMGVTWFCKNKDFGVNSQLDRFMHAKKSPAELKDFQKTSNWLSSKLDQWINPLRLPIDYKEILKDAGIEKTSGQAAWAGLDANQLDRLRNYATKLQKQAKKLAKEGKALPTEQQQILKALPGFFKRLNIFPVVSTALITAATVWIIGDLAMQFVYKFIAPLDKDFDPNKGKKGHEKKDNQPQAKPMIGAAPAVAPFYFPPRPNLPPALGLPPRPLPMPPQPGGVR